MEDKGSREVILNRIRESCQRIREHQKKIPVSQEAIYHPLESDLALCFKKNLERHNGVAILCQNQADFQQQLTQLFLEKKWKKIHCLDPKLIEILNQAKIPHGSEAEDFLQMEVGFTGCEFLVAHLGSAIVSSAQASGRRMNVFPPVHLVLAQKSQLRPYLDDAMEAITEKYSNNLPSMITNITGPSRTADIEKTLILGAHGPKEVYIFIMNQ